MKILYDHQIFSMQKYGGISRYFANLHSGINIQSGASSKLGMIASDNAYINNADLFAGVFNKLIHKKSRRDKYNKWYSKYLLKQNDFDVFHPTYYNPYFLDALKKPFVLTVHDMIHELYPQYFVNEPKTVQYKKETILKADHLIAISECTKKDIQHFYNIPDNKITVIHHGYKMLETVTAPLASANYGDYILFVGDRWTYKNFELFVDAIAPLLLTHKVKLICAGGGRFKPQELERLTQLNIVNNALQLTVSDQQLAQLYRHAMAFVYPSFYEGFGLPVLEAFFNDCPVILSNASSLPEVAGDAAMYFDPDDKKSIAKVIEDVVTSPVKQDELRKKGKERLNHFTFESCLYKTLQVYGMFA